MNHFKVSAAKLLKDIHNSQCFEAGIIKTALCYPSVIIEMITDSAHIRNAWENHAAVIGYDTM